MANIGLSRHQLAQFLPNHEAIKAFESLFANVKESIPSSLDDVQATADNATLQAAEALAGLAQIANVLSLALYGAYSETVSPDIYIPPVALGSMAEQNADKVNISGGSIKVDSLTNGNATTLVASSVALNNGVGAAAGTLLNAPVAGNPTKWIPINDNGTTRYIPSW